MAGHGLGVSIVITTINIMVVVVVTTEDTPMDREVIGVAITVAGTHMVMVATVIRVCAVIIRGITKTKLA